MKKSVYLLTYQDARDETIVFYVGCTNHAARRRAEHRRNSLDQQHPEYNTYKYQWIRQLDQHHTEFQLEVIAQDVVEDRNSEYEYVLKFARYNQLLGRGFYEDMPLTNMRAGDFLSEMMRDSSVTTATEIGAWRQSRAKGSRVTAYDRAQQGSAQGQQQRRNVANAMIEITEQKRIDNVLAELKRQQQQHRQQQELTLIRQQQQAEWIRTGKILNAKEK
jgi:predicted GIY-YIG superfamily endonuclease